MQNHDDKITGESEKRNDNDNDNFINKRIRLENDKLQVMRVLALLIGKYTSHALMHGTEHHSCENVLCFFIFQQNQVLCFLGYVYSFLQPR